MSNRGHLSELIKESEAALRTRLHHNKKALIGRRLCFLLALKTNPALSCEAAGAQAGVGKRGAEKMWALYRDRGIESYCDYPFKGRKTVLKAQDAAWLKEELNKDGTVTLAQAAQKIEQHSGIHYSVSAIHYLFRRLKIKKKTGRPSHIHKDETKTEIFKKKSFRL